MRHYLGTAFFARLAEEGMPVAVVLLALARTGDARLGALVLTAWMAPHIAAAPLAGALAERVRRPVLFHAAALGGLAVAVLTLALLTGRAPVAVVLAVALLGGGCGPVVSGGLSSLVASLARPGRERDRAYARDSTVYNAASVAGPALAASTATVAGPGAAVAGLGCSAALAALLAAFLPAGRGTPTGSAPGAPGAQVVRRRSLGAALVAGLVAVYGVRELRAVTAATCVGFLGMGGLTTTAVLLSAERGRPGDGGLLMTAFAVGALVGSLAVDRLWPRVPAGRLVGATLLGTGVALAAAALVPSPLVCAALFGAAGLCDGPLLTATLRIRADHAPAGVRTQVFTLGAGLKISAAACGAALTGLAAQAPPALLLLAAAATQFVGAALHHFLRRAPRGEIVAASQPTGSGTG
ncbi:MFS transporter [Streptomyces vilmorinianum]|uniref:MFS transporter n=1 Tax=Streptomyces vilmorinianum TaxID=3051092 RepID=UPI0010FB1C95|nr:MFS transporter [Streptomyces vilmorinianum]